MQRSLFDPAFARGRSSAPTDPTAPPRRQIPYHFTVDPRGGVVLDWPRDRYPTIITSTVDWFDLPAGKLEP